MIRKSAQRFFEKHALGLDPQRGRSPFGVAKARGIMLKQDDSTV